MSWEAVGLAVLGGGHAVASPGVQAEVGERSAAFVAHEAVAGFVEHSVAAVAVSVAELHPCPAPSWSGWACCHSCGLMPAESPVEVGEALLVGVASLLRGGRVAGRAVQLDLKGAGPVVGVAQLLPGLLEFFGEPFDGDLPRSARWCSCASSWAWAWARSASASAYSRSACSARVRSSVRRWRAADDAGVDCGVRRVVALRGGFGGEVRTTRGFIGASWAGSPVSSTTPNPTCRRALVSCPVRSSCAAPGSMTAASSVSVSRCSVGALTVWPRVRACVRAVVTSLWTSPCRRSVSSRSLRPSRDTCAWRSSSPRSVRSGDAVGVGADEQVGEPGRECRFAQRFQRCAAAGVTGVLGLLGDPVACRGELFGWQPVELERGRGDVHVTHHAISARPRATSLTAGHRPGLDWQYAGGRRSDACWCRARVALRKV